MSVLTQSKRLFGSDVSCGRAKAEHQALSLAGKALAVLALVALIVSLPDIARYIRIKRM